MVGKQKQTNHLWDVYKTCVSNRIVQKGWKQKDVNYKLYKQNHKWLAWLSLYQQSKLQASSIMKDKKWYFITTKHQLIRNIKDGWPCI